MFLRDLFFAVVAQRSRSDLTGGNVNCPIEWLREGGTFLDVVIGDELEVCALSEGGGFVVEGAVAKVKEQVCGNASTLDGLVELPCGQLSAIG